MSTSFELPGLGACRFELQGHRGARGLFAENTIAGFVGALAFGLDSIELDIAVTADDVVVVVHDPVLSTDLTRDAGMRWLEPPAPAIRALTWLQLQDYDVGRARPGSVAALAHPDQRSQDGARIPTLAAVFEATAGACIRIDAELKTDPLQPDLTVPPAVMAEAVVAVAREAGALHRLAIRSFDWRGLAHLRTHHPAIPLAWLTGANQGDGTPSEVAAAAAGASYRPTWAPFHASLSRSMLDTAHAMGLRVVPWTVNEATDMARLIEWGVDGLCTDRPDRAREMVTALR